MQPYVYGPKFMWNLDHSVGKDGANSIVSDVSFIQWYYTLAANFYLTSPDHKELYRKVKITGRCNGTDNDPLVQAIFAQQSSMNHPSVDGKVSVVTGTAHLGVYAFFLLRLEARFAVMFPNAWPVSRFAVPNMSELTH